MESPTTPVLNESARSILEKAGNTAHLRASHSGSRLADGGELLHGDLENDGYSISRHDLAATPRSLRHPSRKSETLELCLNIKGEGHIRSGRNEVAIQPLTALFYVARPQVTTHRRGSEPHEFLTIAFARSFLKQHLDGSDGAIHPLVEDWLRSEPGKSQPVSRRLTEPFQHLAGQLAHPPVFQAARRLWFSGKVLELMAEYFFQQTGTDELFCDRQKRMARQRVDAVVRLLREHLTEPPSLDEIGRIVGCSPFYLSRTFSREMSMTIPQYLRRIRMERAAELLRSGKFNVTEAALEVGYSSLSHFSQAFCQTIGCCPNLYPAAAGLHHAGPATASTERA